MPGGCQCLLTVALSKRDQSDAGGYQIGRHRMAVMHEGRIVEQGDTVEILQNPQHEYTRTLLSAVPRL